MNFDSSRPIYIQIIEGFQVKIATGDMAPGDKIPSQRDLARELKVNPNTIQRSYREMEYLGIIETIRGQGTFIKKDEKLVELTREKMVNDLTINFLKKMKELGYEKDQVINIIKNEGV